MKLNTVEEGIDAIKNGEMIIVVDDEDRENEGDLVMAAEKVTTEAINFMVTHARGLVCLSLTQARAEALNLKPMVKENTDQLHTAFTISIDGIATTTGISAQERAHTILSTMQSNAKPSDFKRPGHIFPLIAKEGGVLKRAGHTEASVDLSTLAGLTPAGVICEIMNEDGSMARVPDLLKYKEKHTLKMISIADLIKHRNKHNSYIKRAAESELPTAHGMFKMVGYENTLNGEHHVALVKGDIQPDQPTLVRVHSECLTGDAFSSKRCDCGEQLNEALHKIEEAGKGILLYMRQEGRGIGLINKIKAYNLQDQGMDTVEANQALGFEDDLRDYGIGAQILNDLGAKSLKLMTNNPRKINGLAGFGIDVIERIPIQMNHNEKNQYYLKTKKQKLGHMLNFKKEQ